MSQDVKFNIKLSIDGKEHIVEASTSVKKFADELGIATTKTEVLRESVLFFNHTTQAILNVYSGLQQFTGLMLITTLMLSRSQQQDL